jgi:hypothetical protein
MKMLSASSPMISVDIRFVGDAENIQTLMDARVDQADLGYCGY